MFNVELAKTTEKKGDEKERTENFNNGKKKTSTKANRVNSTIM